MPMVIRVPNWHVSGGLLTIYCDRCGRHLLRTTAIVEGNVFYLPCKRKGCGERTFVVPAAALEQWRNAA